MKKTVFFTACVITGASLTAQILPKDKDARKYFEKLQTERVESTGLIEWKQIGPGTAGYCEAIWMHPTDPKVMIMSPDMYNTYGSFDGGESWVTVKDCDAWDRQMIRVMCLDFSRNNPDFGLAVDTRGNLMRTVNRGRSWEKINEVKQHSAIAVDPKNDNIWYLGPGRFWDVKKNHRTEKTLKDPSYGSKKQGYIYVSTDKGKSWKKMTDGLPKGLEVGRIIVSPENSKKIIIATTHGIFISENSGKSWRLSNNGLDNCIIRDLDSHYDIKTGKLTLFAINQTAYYPDGKTVKSEGGIFRSDDEGETWKCINGDLAIDMTRIKEKTVNNFLYARTISGWFGISTKELNQRFPEKPRSILSVFNRIQVNPQNPDDIYICGNVKHDFGFAPGDIWKTEDGGKHWYATARSGGYWLNGRDKEYWESRNNPLQPNTKFAHLQPEVNRRTETWGTRFLEMTCNGTLFACIEQQVFRSVNRGKSWEQYDDIEAKPGSGCWIGRGASNLPGRFILLDTGVKGRVLLCSGEHGLWQNAPLYDYKDRKTVAVKQLEGQCNDKSAHSISCVAVDPKNPNIIYTTQFRQNHRGYFRRSTDNGKTWENISYPLQCGGNISSENLFQHSLIVDPENTKNIYFTVSDYSISDVSFVKASKLFKKYGIYRSKDAGYNWELINNGLPAGACARRIIFDVDNPEILYAALNSKPIIKGVPGVTGGLFVSNNRGDKWVEMTIPDEITSVNDVFQDKKTKDLYISCGTEKGSLEEGGVWRSPDRGKTWEKIFFLPYIWQTNVSPLDSNIITVIAAGQKKPEPSYNPGIYVSLDGGKTWNKVNRNLGQPDTIVDFKPDNQDKNKFWAALKGSGWAIGYMNN